MATARINFGDFDNLSVNTQISFGYFDNLSIDSSNVTNDFINLKIPSKQKVLSVIKTLIIVILDESGSMIFKKREVIDGFNQFLDEQKAVEDDEAHFYMVKFNSVITMVHKGTPIKDVPHLSMESYRPDGGTALYNVIAEGVEMAETNKKSDQRVICVIMTDGQENCSRKVTIKERIKSIISGKESQGDWTFLYIGENPERWAQTTGMHSRNSVHFDHANPSASFHQASFAVRSFRSSHSLQAPNLFRP